MICGYDRVSTDGRSVDGRVRQLTQGRMQQRVPRDGERSQDRPHLTSQSDCQARRGRRADRDAARPTGAIDAGSPVYPRHDRRPPGGLPIDTWVDTTTPHARLMLTVLGGLAEFERQARGVKMGRPPKLTPHQAKEAIKRREAGEPMRDIAKSYNVSHSTISRLTEQVA